MRLHRFYTSEKIEPPIVGSITHYLGSDQWRKVFRFKAGDKVILFDGSGFDFLCEIQSYTANTQGRGEKGNESCAEVKILEVMNNVVVPVRETSLFCAVLKKDTFEWVVEKATEMGVSRIVPVLAERSEKKNLNIERLQKIIIEASEQSGRGTLPVLGDIISFDEAVELAMGDAAGSGSGMNSVVMDPTGKAFACEALKEEKGMPVALWIGPEGGWAPSELAVFNEKASENKSKNEKEKEKEVAIFSMGPQILRAETAVVAALALVQSA